MKILITGGAGYIGSILVSKMLFADRETHLLSGVTHDLALDNRSHRLDVSKIVVYDNLMYKQICLTDFSYMPHFEFVYGDVRNHDKLKEYVKEADVIIPLAAIVGFPACDKDPRLAKEVNQDQIEFILKNTSPQQQIVYPNTNSGYGLGQGDAFCTEETPLKPISVYGTTKCAAEQMLLDSGRAITLRLATVFGVSPRMRLDLLVNDFTYKAVNDGYIVLFEKDFKRNFIHIRDVALTFIFMINEYSKYVGQTFNVGLSDTNISKLELANKIKEHIPDFVIKVDDYKSDPDKRNYIVSNEKLEKTGWKPYYSLESGIKELIRAYKIILHNNKKFTNL
jgi:nucleoside-diphosphate-sugar epimerase